MAPLCDSFDDAQDDFPPPGPVVRPMECRDSWAMTVLVQRQAAGSLDGTQFIALKNTFENMIPKILVDVQVGGKISGFIVATSQVENFANSRGMLKLVTSPDHDRAESAKRLLRGLARQIMATGQTSMELVVADDDDVLKDVCKLYQGVCVKAAKTLGDFPATNAHVIRIDDLTRHFGHKPQGGKPKDPSP